MQLRVGIIPDKHDSATLIREEFCEVVNKHPLISERMTAEGEPLSLMTVLLRLRNDGYSAETCFNWHTYRACIEFNPNKYSSNLNQVLAHEFSHVLDRINPELDWDCEEEAKAQMITLEGVPTDQFTIFEHIWNCYIDGRLEQSFMSPKKLEERIEELLDHTKSFGQFDSAIDKVIKKAWHAKNLSLKDMIELSGECQQYWHPNKKG